MNFWSCSPLESGCASRNSYLKSIYNLHPSSLYSLARIKKKIQEQNWKKEKVQFCNNQTIDTDAYCSAWACCLFPLWKLWFICHCSLSLSLSVFIRTTPVGGSSRKRKCQQCVSQHPRVNSYPPQSPCILPPSSPISLHLLSSFSPLPFSLHTHISLTAPLSLCLGCCSPDSIFSRLQNSRAQETGLCPPGRLQASSPHSFTLWILSWHGKSCRQCQRGK